VSAKRSLAFGMQISFVKIFMSTAS
jgi:hypothetical protein